MSAEIGDLEQYVLKILQPERRETNGTGFFCHPDGYILTCHHVIEPHLNAGRNGRNDVNIIYRDEEHQARICEEYSIEDADIAVLKLVRPLPSSELKYLLLDTHKRWDVGDEIYSFGYPEGYFSKPGIPIYGSVGGPTEVEGASVIQITGLNLRNVDHGYSGAPVLNLRNKKVIGLINARYQPTQAFFVPLTELLKRWQELRIFHDVFKEIRSKLAKEAQKGLEGKLGESGFIPLRLECGTVPERRKEEVEVMEQGAREWSAHGRKWEDFDLKKLTSFSRSYILSSSVGTGKTTFLYWLATQLTDTDTDTDTAPVFMPCADFERLNPLNWNKLREHLTSFFTFKYGFLEEDIKDFFDTYFRDGKIFFLFDGLDQIKGDDYTSLVNTIFKIITNNRVIISSRPSAVIPLESKRELPFLRLKPFYSEDIKLYFGDDYEQARSISRFAPDLIRVPMLAFMLKTLIRKGKAKNIFNRADIYARFLEHVIYQHEPNRPLVTDAQLIEGVKKALKRISFDALNLNEPQIQKISINLPVIEDLNREFGININALTKFGLVNLILEMGDITQHSLFFTHQSFQEFLAAQYISESEDSKRLDTVINEMWSPKWREVIKFLAGIRGQEIVEKIYSQGNDKEDNIIHSRLFLAAECLAEVREARGELKEEINQKLKELVRIEPFRFDAIIALGFLGDITSLKSLLWDLDWRVHEAAVKALAVFKDRINDKVVKEIAARVRDDNGEVRESAYRTLKIFYESGIPLPGQ